MDILEWVRGAIILLVGAFMMFVIFSELCEAYPDFYNIGWPLIAAFIAGAVVYLKYGLSK